jgi:hypothetical protein
MPVGNEVLVVADAKSAKVYRLLAILELFLATSSDLTQFTFHILLLLYYLQSHEAVLILS